MPQSQRGFIGLIALLITVLIIGIWFAMDLRGTFGSGSGSTTTAPLDDQIAPSAVDEGALQKAEDVKLQTEAGYKNTLQQY